MPWGWPGSFAVAFRATMVSTNAATAPAASPPTVALARNMLRPSPPRPGPHRTGPSRATTSNGSAIERGVAQVVERTVLGKDIVVEPFPVEELAYQIIK